jgi:WD40 repeat protein
MSAVAHSDDQVDRIFARQLGALADEIPVPPRFGLAGSAPQSRRVGMPGRTLVVTGLLLALSVALAWTMAIVGQSPPAPSTFPVGSLAFVRSGSLYVAGADGAGAKLVTSAADGNVLRFGFSPDRTSLAYTRVADQATARQELVIVDADGQIVGTDASAAAPQRSGESMIFGWAPDSQRLAVYPGQSDAEIAIVDRDGTATQTLPIPDLEVSAFDWSRLAWSADARRIAVPTSGERYCPDGTSQTVCYAMVASDGSGITTLAPNPLSVQASPAQFAWASDGGYALAHWGPTGGYPGSVASVEIHTGDPQNGYTVAPLPEFINAVPGRTLAWSPNGSRLAVATVDSRMGPVFYLFVDGNDTRFPMNPVPPTESILMVVWSPEGSHLIFATSPNEGGGMSIWSVGLEGGVPSKLLDADGTMFDVAGSAFGTDNSVSTSSAVRPS